jgi:hypothetical protein
MMGRRKDTCRSRSLGMLSVMAVVLTGFSCIATGTPEAGGGHGPLLGYEPWWNYEWSFRKPMTIDNTQNTNNLKDYPALFNMSVQELISAGKMQSDRSDMRFIDSDEIGRASCRERVSRSV